MKNGLRFAAVILLCICTCGLILPVIVMDSLTYGDPPGLFKGPLWQAVRRLWD